jgi:hypothetical protein
MVDHELRPRGDRSGSEGRKQDGGDVVVRRGCARIGQVVLDVKVVALRHLFLVHNFKGSARGFGQLVVWSLEHEPPVVAAAKLLAGQLARQFDGWAGQHESGAIDPEPGPGKRGGAGDPVMGGDLRCEILHRLRRLPGMAGDIADALDEDLVSLGPADDFRFKAQIGHCHSGSHLRTVEDQTNTQGPGADDRGTRRPPWHSAALWPERMPPWRTAWV